MVLLGEVDNLTWGQNTEPILKFEDYTEAGCGKKLGRYIDHVQGY